MEDAPTIDATGNSVVTPPPESTRGGIAFLLRNRFGHWRTGWRLLLYFTAVALLAVAFGTPLALFDIGLDEAPLASWTHMLGWVVGNLALILAGLGTLRWFDRRPKRLLGLGFGRGWARELAIGLAAGVLSITTLALLLIVSRSVTVAPSPHMAGALAVLPRYLLTFTLAAAFEELVFRGYPLQALAEGSRRWLAAGLLCLLFSIMHLGNPDMGVIPALNIFLVGVLLAVVYFKTLRLWMPIGLHLSWNLAQSWLWGFDVSGVDLPDSLLAVTPTGPELITGGGFGLEGSLLTTALVLLGTLWLLFSQAPTPTAETRALWARYPSGFGIGPVADAPLDENGDRADQ